MLWGPRTGLGEVGEDEERWGEVFHANAFCSSRALEDVFHQAVALHSERKSRTVRKTDDLEGRRYWC